MRGPLAYIAVISILPGRYNLFSHNHYFMPQQRQNPFAFKLGKKIGRYKVVEPAGLVAAPNRLARPLSDKGATSIVYLVEQSIGGLASIPRVMKIFAPSEKVRKRNLAAGKSYGKANFIEEMKLLSELTHQNVVKIIDAGEVENSNYYVMEFIRGSTLEDLLDSRKNEYAAAKQRAQTDPYLVIRLARQLCYALMYMHTNRYYHFDVAPKNIFVREVTLRPHVVLGDLGVARRVAPSDKANAGNLIYVAGTRDYTP